MLSRRCLRALQLGRDQQPAKIWQRTPCSEPRVPSESVSPAAGRSSPKNEGTRATGEQPFDKFEPFCTHTVGEQPAIPLARDATGTTSTTMTPIDWCSDRPSPTPALALMLGLRGSRKTAQSLASRTAV